MSVHEPTCPHCGEPIYSAEEADGCGSCADIVGPLKSRIAELEAALDEALEEWEYAAGYKGDYLRQKHGDVEQIETFRALLAADDPHNPGRGPNATRPT